MSGYVRSYGEEVACTIVCFSTAALFHTELHSQISTDLNGLKLKICCVPRGKSVYLYGSVKVIGVMYCNCDRLTETMECSHSC